MLTFTNDVTAALSEAISRINPSSAFALCDEGTHFIAAPIAEEHGLKLITIPQGDSNKNLESAVCVWGALSEGGANRRSLLVNIGGGVVTDLGGFAASTFKRGIPFINIPTTLLSAVDAAVGGKTGINFGGLKNEIGVFNPAKEVIISTRVFATLPPKELLSGYAEMLKHALLTSREETAKIMAHDLSDLDTLLPMLKESVMVKKRIVEQDPMEKGIRKALNLGHTAGHAIESRALSAGSPMPHGYAVAYGLVTALVLSNLKLGFPGELLHQICAFIRENYGTPGIACRDTDELIKLMLHDKKNTQAGTVNFTLLANPGDIRIDQAVGNEDIQAALDITADFLGQ